MQQLFAGMNEKGIGPHKHCNAMNVSLADNCWLTQINVDHHAVVLGHLSVIDKEI